MSDDVLTWSEADDHRKRNLEDLRKASASNPSLLAALDFTEAVATAWMALIRSGKIEPRDLFTALLTAFVPLLCEAVTNTMPDDLQERMIDGFADQLRDDTKVKVHDGRTKKMYRRPNA